MTGAAGRGDPHVNIVDHVTRECIRAADAMPFLTSGQARSILARQIDDDCNERRDLRSAAPLRHDLDRAAW